MLHFSIGNSGKLLRHRLIFRNHARDCRERVIEKRPTPSFHCFASSAQPYVLRPCWSSYKHKWAHSFSSAMFSSIYHLLLKKGGGASEYSPRNYLILFSPDRSSVTKQNYRDSAYSRQTQHQVSYNWHLVRGHETRAVGASALRARWQQLPCVSECCQAGSSITVCFVLCILKMEMKPPAPPQTVRLDGRELNEPRIKELAQAEGRKSIKRWEVFTSLEPASSPGWRQGGWRGWGWDPCVRAGQPEGKWVSHIEKPLSV